jgi:ATP:ADP antiporter, AAA family
LADSTVGDRHAALAAAAVAAALIAQQVAGKATRDALFLSTFPVSALPRIVIVSALLSGLVVLGWSRLLRRRGPYPLMPLAFVASGLTMLVIALAASRAPALAIVATYLHVAVLGPVLISGFWSLLNERFDPRAAKKTFARVAAYGALGGLAGGLLAERVAAWAGTAAMLPVLGGLHLTCAVFAAGVRPSPIASAEIVKPLPFEDVRAVLRTPYLRSLGVLVLLGAVSAALLDYAFKANAVHALSGVGRLMRLFSAYHAGVALLAFAVQLLASRRILERAGLARTVATLPLVTFAGGVMAGWLPGLASTVIARGSEGVLRNSLFRSGYELLFTPIPARLRRASKIFIDVGFERAGDALGGALVTVLLAIGIADPSLALPWITAGLSILAVIVALRIHRGYVTTLESSLLAGEIALDPEVVSDATTRSVALHTQSLRALMNRAPALLDAVSPAAPVVSLGRNPDLMAQRIDLAPFGVVADPRQTPSTSLPLAPIAGAGTKPSDERRLLERAADLASHDATRIRGALVERLEGPLVPYALALLERGDLAPEVLGALRPLVADIAGQLGDALVERARPLAARRRIARLLGTTSTPRTIEALLHGLDDASFEVRHACGTALAHMRSADATLVFDSDRVFAVARREVEVEESVWRGRRDMDRLNDGGSAITDAYLSVRASASLEHVFAVLSLVLAHRPLRIAFRGVSGDDPMSRGLALEYLESVLPSDIRDRLWPFLEVDSRVPRTQRVREDILAELLRSHESIAIRMSELGGDAQP